MATQVNEHDTRQRAWLTLAALLAPATLLMALDRSVVSIAAPLLQTRYGLTLSELGLIFSVFSWSYALMQIPAGVLVSRFGPRITIMGAILLWSAMTAITPFAGSFGLLLVVRALLAIGQSPDWPGCLVSIERLFPSRGRSIATGVLMGSVNCGFVVGAPLAAFLIISVGLEDMFLICGGMGIAFAVIWWIFFRLPAGQIDPGALTEPLIPLREVAKSGRVWLLAACYACTGSLLSFYQTLFPTYLAKDRGMGLQQIGNYAAIPAAVLCLAALIAGPILGYVCGRTRSIRKARLPFAIGSLAVVAVISTIVPWLTSDTAIIIAASGSLTAIGFAQVTTWCVVQDIGQADTATVTGFITFSGNLAAGLLPLIAAQLVSYTGKWDASFGLLAIVAAVGCLLWLFVDPDRPLSIGRPKSRA
jgi:ACS family glucarate transporter-like MFS transporter